MSEAKRIAEADYLAAYGTGSISHLTLQEHTLLGDPALLVRAAGVTGVTAGRGRGGVLSVEPARPNPGNPRMEILVRLDGDAGSVIDVRAEVYDLRGRKVATLMEGALPPGGHSLVWDGRDRMECEVGTGAYLVRVVAGGEVRAVKVLVVR